VRQHNNARADEAAFADGDATGKDGTGCNVHAVAQLAFVVYARMRIDDARAAQPRRGANCSKREHLAAGAERGVGGDKRGSMHHSRRLDAVLSEQLLDLEAIATAGAAYRRESEQLTGVSFAPL
jgi:hypothetical protein